MISYHADVVAWAQEQARLLREGQFGALDIEHLAEEIEDVGKSEKRELRSRMTILLAHLLKWRHQPERRGSSWRRTIQEQRRQVASCLEQTPSLKPDLRDADWWAGVWADALDNATRETGYWYDAFPESCPWSEDEVLQHDFWPD